MRVKSGFFGGLICGDRRWTLAFDDQFVVYAKETQPATSIPIGAITGVSAKSGLIWSTIEIETPGKRIVAKGTLNQAAKEFVSPLCAAIGRALLSEVELLRPALLQFESKWHQLLEQHRYIANYDVEAWKETIPPAHYAILTRALALLRNPLFPAQGPSPETRPLLNLLEDVLAGGRSQLKSRNKQLVAGEVARFKEFFDRVEPTPLTAEQRMASVEMEDCNLLVAAAGSGKTSTVVGKVGYSLLTKQYVPEDLLVLAFNSDAAKELDVQINEKLRPWVPVGEPVKATTFHALGLEIITGAEHRKPSIANFAGAGEAAENTYIESLIQDCLARDPKFALAWVTFKSVCFKPTRNPLEFSSKEDWDSYVRAHGDYKDGKRGFLTIQGEVVKSQGELAIANWLYLQGVPYEYERPYEYETADNNRRQYRPDFYLPAIRTYLEHYALDKNGNPPASFGARYRESMAWKAQLHAEKTTALMTTTFDDFVTGRLFPRLERELRSRGQPLAPRPIEQVIERLNAYQRKAEFSAFLRTFIKHARSNEIDSETLRSRVKKCRQSFRAETFRLVIQPLMDAYERRLMDKAEIDFEDMINKAANYVSDRRQRHRYKMILVDECQDMSQSRAKLIKALLTQAPGCKLFAVGDDWQSIYRFAGADIDVLTHFPRYFGVTATNYLTRTFRSNQGISDVASRFVQKNPAQMRKQVQAQDPKSSQVVVVRRSSASDLERECLASLKEIAASVSDGTRASVFILARYRIKQPTAISAWKAQFRMLDIAFKTIHSSKGLQADFVIITGLDTGLYAFPAEISDDPLLQLVMPEPESFENAEERRLLYVAMTRARHGVYLIGSEYFPSPFLSELIDDDANRENIRIEPGAAECAIANGGQISAPLGTCPKCKKGRLRRITGKYGEFIGCSAYPSCNFTRDIGRD